MFAFVFYILGIGALFGADLLITTFSSQEIIKQWAAVRSLIGITGTLCLIGFDYVLIRSPQSSARLLRLLAVQIPVLALVVGLFVWSFGFLSHFVISVAIAAGSAASLCLSQYFRSNKKNLKSQLVRQSWKIFAFIISIWMVITKGELQIDLALAVILLVTVAGASAVVLHDRPSRLYPQNPEPFRDLYRIGSRFMVTSVFLALAVYAEQLVVNALGSAKEAAMYFTHAAYFLFPISIANGYLAFLLGPWIRDNHDRFFQLLRARGALVLLMAGSYAVIVNFVGWQGWQVTTPAVGPVDSTLQMFFLFSAFMRTLYTLPSGYNGVFGRPRQHDMLILAQVASLGTVTVLFMVIRDAGIDLVHAVAFASSLNWMLRCLAGFFVMGLIHRMRAGERNA